MNKMKTLALHGNAYQPMAAEPMAAEAQPLHPNQEGLWLVNSYAPVHIKTVMLLGASRSRLTDVTQAARAPKPITDEPKKAPLGLVYSFDPVLEESESSLLHVKNFGDEPESFRVVVLGRSHLRDDQRTDQPTSSPSTEWTSGFGAWRVSPPQSPKPTTISRTESGSSTISVPFRTRVVRVRMKTDARPGILRVGALQVGNLNMLDGQPLPIELFKDDGLLLESPILSAGTRLMGAVVSNDPSDAYWFEIFWDVLAPGEVEAA